MGQPAATADELPPFVEASWVLGRLDGVTLADVRYSPDGSENYDTYLASHLPGAIYVDLDSVLASAPGGEGGRHPLPTAETFARGLGAAGIGDDEVVVAYDHGPGAVASRLVWMLRAIGQPAAVLDGGLASWPGEVESGDVHRPPERRQVRPWPSKRLADAELTRGLALSPSAVIIDARAPERYRGEIEPIDPLPGHVPGAVNVPFTDNLDDAGRLLPKAELRARYRDVGALDADEVVAYCGSGVTACHDLLVLEHVDGGAGRLYAGSWSGWSSDPRRPVATGPTPG